MMVVRLLLARPPLLTGRGVMAARMLWEHVVRVQISAPRQKQRWAGEGADRRKLKNYFKNGFPPNKVGRGSLK